MTLANSKISDDVANCIIRQAQLSYNQSRSSDSLDWWIVKTTEAYLNGHIQFINTERNQPK